MFNKKLLALLIAMSLIFAGCKDDDNKDDDDGIKIVDCNTLDLSSKTMESIQFGSVSAPSTDEEKVSVRVSPYITVKYTDNTSYNCKLDWQVIAKSGDEFGSAIFGGNVDFNGDPIPSLLDMGSDNQEPTYSNNPDGMTLHKVGDNYHLITQFEDRPGVLYNSKMSLADGVFTIDSTEPVDVSGVSGTHTNCAATKTPWGTHMAPEEDYDMDGIRYATQTSVQDIIGTTNDLVTDPENPVYGMHIDACTDEYDGVDYSCKTFYAQYEYLTGTKATGPADIKSTVNPYLYGYNFEVVVDSTTGDATVKDNSKHYVFGKYTPENATVMPDRKTVYITDDGGYIGIYKFVADTAGDLSAGTLYAIKLTNQLTDTNQSTAITWVELGSSNDSELKTIIEKEPNFSDMWDVVSASDKTTCEANSGYRYMKSNGYTICAAPKNGIVLAREATVFTSDAEAQTAISFLEARRWAEYNGATIEWNKAEGIIYDKEHNVVWMGITDIDGAMDTDDSGYSNGDKILFNENTCGGVFKFTLDGTTNYNATNVELWFTQGNDGSAKKSCSDDELASPDNLRYIGYNTLLIGEDTGAHDNNMAWALNTETKELTRILTGPTDAEITGMFGYIDAGGNTFFMTGIQHPAGGYSWDTTEAKKGIVGYIKGIPALGYTTY